MLSFCRAYTKNRYKNFKKKTKLNRYKKHISILKNIIKYYSLKLYGDEVKVLKDLKQKENINKNPVDIRKRIVTTPQDKNYKFLENITILKNLFNDEKIVRKKLFKVDKVMNIFNIYEFLCWDEIKDNINNEYKMELDENIKIKFDLFYKGFNLSISPVVSVVYFNFKDDSCGTC